MRWNFLVSHALRWCANTACTKADWRYCGFCTVSGGAGGRGRTQSRAGFRIPSFSCGMREYFPVDIECTRGPELLLRCLDYGVPPANVGHSRGYHRYHHHGGSGWRIWLEVEDSDQTGGEIYRYGRLLLACDR